MSLKETIKEILRYFDIHKIGFPEHTLDEKADQILDRIDEAIDKVEIALLIKQLQDGFYSAEHSPAGLTVYDYIAQGIRQAIKKAVRE